VHVDAREVGAGGDGLHGELVDARVAEVRRVFEPRQHRADGPLHHPAQPRPRVLVLPRVGDVTLPRRQAGLHRRAHRLAEVEAGVGQRRHREQHEEQGLHDGARLYRCAPTCTALTTQPHESPSARSVHTEAAMHTLSLVTALFLSMTSAELDAVPGLSARSHRAARLMAPEEVEQLAAFDRRLSDLRVAPGTTALRVSGIVGLSLGVAPIVIFAAIGALGGFFGGLYALAANVTWGSVFADVFAAIFARWIPLGAYLAMGVAVVIGAALLISSFVTDAPRQREVRQLEADRRAFIDTISAERRDLPTAVAPMTTLVTF
jgi:hypothetical protein